MSGIVNSTGAVSGVIGTTVGTPVSKIVQVQYYERTAQYFQQNPGTGWFSTTSLTACTITPVSSSNYLLLQLSVNSWWIFSNGSTYHAQLRFSYNASDLSETYFGTVTYLASTYDIANSNWNQENFNYQKRISMPSANEITIIPYFKLGSDEETYMPNSTGQISLTLWEIQA